MPVQWAQRLDENGAKLGSSFQFSRPRNPETARCRASPTNAAADGYLVVWYSFKSGRTLSLRPAHLRRRRGDRHRHRLTTTGTADDDKKAYDPAIAYNPRPVTTC